MHLTAPHGRKRRAIRRGLTAVSLAACAVVVVHPVDGYARADTAGLAVEYKTSTGASAGEIEPWFKVENTSDHSVALNQVTLRYYFTADTDSPYTFACAWAVVGCANLSGTVVPMAHPTSAADHYLRIDFSVGSLPAGGDTGDIQLRLYRADWRTVNQANDYSFGEEQTAYSRWDKVTAYIDGMLVWGTPAAPGDDGGGDDGGTPPTSTGVLFDDFDYTDSSDPRLSAHGWSVRTGGGGPGVIGATWSADAIAFPSDTSASDHKVMQLTATTDGTAGNTTQAEIDTVQRKFFDGTYAARVHFSDAPATGPNGDHVVQTFYTISPLRGNNDPTYSELDFEYLPNGGWGANGPRMYTTTWYTYATNPYSQDNRSHSELNSLQGWHTLVAQVSDGTVTYYIDGDRYFATSGKYYPRKNMTIDFNQWFINGELAADPTSRAWKERVDWVYYAGGEVLSPAEVDTRIGAYRSTDTPFADTVPAADNG